MNGAIAPQVDVQTARRAAASVADPEIPVLTVEDLGVLRDVRALDGGGVEVVITPTYSGCPALQTMADDIEQAVRDAGVSEVSVRIALAPAWTTDWMSDQGRRKLAEYGIAPPAPRGHGTRGLGPVPVQLGRRRETDLIRCPQCGSPDVRELSRFGATACRSLWQCGSCHEPFDHFKTI